ncbi:MAG: hypothetical protein JXR94_16750 [Candidatus Hydrogenedentes bacterium]|nr:hypothetical protein [Candidatus Hydrogenedentota bacterium]
MKHVTLCTRPEPLPADGGFRIPWCWWRVYVKGYLGVDKYCDPIVPD